MKNTLLFFGLALLLFACQQDDIEFLTVEEQFELDRQLIEKYLGDNNITAIYAEDRGIYYDIEVEGTGGSPTINNTVEVRYKGYLLNGDVFDETQNDNTIEFGLGRVILGWQNAIPLLQKGGKGTFYIPSALAYGNNSLPGIPANSPLVFEVELIDFR